MVVAASGFLMSTDCSVEVTQRVLAQPGPGGRGLGAGLAISVATVLAVSVGSAVLVVTARHAGLVAGWWKNRWQAVAGLAVVAAVGLLAAMFYGFASQRAVGLADDQEPAHSGLVELRYTGEDTSAAGVGHWAEVYRWSSDAFLALSVATTALALALARGWRPSGSWPSCSCRFSASSPWCRQAWPTSTTPRPVATGAGSPARRPPSCCGSQPPSGFPSR